MYVILLVKNLVKAGGRKSIAFFLFPLLWAIESVGKERARMNSIIKRKKVYFFSLPDQAHN